MAVQLFLDDTEIIIDSSQEIRVTKENPYFTLSDSYTLDVHIPLDIFQNRLFFGNIQRIGTSKSYKEYSCRLLCGNVQVLEGTARIVQSTDLLVKVQLASGVSALKMSSEQEGSFIDKLVLEDGKEGVSFDMFNPNIDYGPMYNFSREAGYGIPLKDNTNDMPVNIAYWAGNTLVGNHYTEFYYVSECPPLISVAQSIIKKLGYWLDTSCLPEACRNIYIVTAIQGDIPKKLPNWTVKEFLAQFQNFFGCTIIGTGGRYLKMVPLGEYINNSTVEIEPVDAFQVDYSENDEAEGIINSNIEYQMECSDIEVVERTYLDHAEYSEEFSNIGSMENAFRTDDDDVKMRKLYKMNGETYIGWEIGEGKRELKRIAPFNPLVRYEDADTVQLKIAPVYIEEDVKCSLVYSPEMGYQFTRTFSLNLPSVSNPYGLRSIIEKNTSYSNETTPTLQSLVEGTEAIVGDGEKPDILNVAFIDGNKETVYIANGDGTSFKEFEYDIHLAFTDYSFKKQFTNNRKRWNFSLMELQGYDFYIGQLHKVSFTCSRKVKHIIKFVSSAIPDPTSIFLIHGKKFACEKIEAGIKDGQLDTLMIGYFYEIQSEHPLV